MATTPVDEGGGVRESLVAGCTMKNNTEYLVALRFGTVCDGMSDLMGRWNACSGVQPPVG